MNIKIEDILDKNLLTEMLDKRYVKKQNHPTDPLFIYNYTQNAQFDKVWNSVTLACRGLITNADDVVLARPFSKFFNLAEHDISELPSGNVEVTEKLDGSLGILYPNQSGYALATRGSFNSEQCLHATRIWDSRYADSFSPNPDWTYLFEIVYPTNRIVVNYGDVNDLFLLGAIDIKSGCSVSFDEACTSWNGPVVEKHPYTTLTEAIAVPSRDNREGLVVRYIDSDLRVKLKHEEYVRLHRIITGVSERRIWEALSTGVDLDKWLDGVPDEFFSFVTSTRDKFFLDKASLEVEIENKFAEVVASLPENYSRKDFAVKVKELSSWSLFKALFLRLDNKSYDHIIWRELKPSEHSTVWGSAAEVD